MGSARKLAFGLLTLVLLLLIAEILLRLPPKYRDRGVIFKTGPGHTVRFIATSPGTSFQVPKPPGTFRIFCFGESVVEGAVYNPQSSFSKLLAEMLQDLSLGTRVEVINCGATGSWSEWVLGAFSQALRYQPDLMVIYCGNNEYFHYTYANRARHPLLNRLLIFLRGHSRLFLMGSESSRDIILAGMVGVSRLGEGQDRFAELFPGPRRAEINESFRLNIRDMIAGAGRAGVPVLLCLPAANLKWPPDHSVCGRGREQCEALETQLDRAMELLPRQPAAAEALARQVLQSVPRHARGRYVLGLALLAEGQRRAGRVEMEVSLEDKDSPAMWTRPSQRMILEQLAAQTHTELVDAYREFNAQAPDGSAGFDLIDDYCHPSLEGQALIAALLAEGISRRYPASFVPTASALPFADREWYLGRLNLSPGFVAQRFQEMAFFLAFFFDDRTLSDQSLKMLAKQKALIPESTLLDLVEGLVRLRQAADDPARAAFERALRQNPDHSARMIDLYFQRFLRWQPPYLLVQARPGTSFNPILNDYLAPEKSKTRLGLNHADHIYLLAGNTLTDVSAPVLKRVAERKRQPPPAPLTLFPAADTDGRRFTTAGLNQVGDRFTAAGPDPRLSFGLLNLDPRGLAALEVELEVEGPSAPRQRLCLYWRSSQPNFREQDKACAEPDLAGGAGVYLVPLADDPDWVMAGTVRGLRLDPGEGAITFRLKKAQLLPYSPPRE